MIQVERIQIREFRGIRNLTVDFSRKNFAICGPNGTGKSGVVDALEFALTGSISRLSGRGTGDVSVSKHAPHVDSRDRPDKARVVLEVWIPELKKKASIERSVQTSSAPVIKPNDPDVIAALKQAEVHPEFALSRRELIRYVISAPGDRSKEVQALLRLDSVEEIRSVLLRISNSAKKETRPLSQEKIQARDALLRALEIGNLTEDSVLEAANGRRKVLGLPPIGKLQSSTSLRDGLAAAAAARPSRVPKAAALADLKALREGLDLITSAQAEADQIALKEKLLELQRDAALLAGVEREKFLDQAIQYIEADACPVCDTSWKPGELERKVRAKLSALKEAARKRADAERQIDPIVREWQAVHDLLPTIERYATMLSPSVDASHLKALRESLKAKTNALRAFLPLEPTLAAVNSPDVATARETLSEIEGAVSAIPDPTEQDVARDYLTVAQERLEAYRAVSLRLKSAEDRATLTKTIYDTYADASTSVLEGIYKDVEKNFSELYRYINRDDEASFTAHLTPSIGKLGFDVDFYGRGHFPPGAYHSEGHQDGMGLCLYLALMRHLLGDGFTFAVLDDVLMSVDTGHRREVCNLLREQFPNTQFVLTTHDKIWLKHMEAVGLIPPGSSRQFRRWDVNEGPTEWRDRDIWNEIEAELKAGHVNFAASLLRHYLEFFSSTIAHGLRARVEYREDAQYQLGDLLPPVIGRVRDLLKKAKDCAASWQKPIDGIESRERDFLERVKTSGIEQWAINPAIHYNNWENFEPADFAPVVAAFRSLCQGLSCPQCFSMLYVIPERGPHDEEDALRCSCGEVMLNLTRQKLKSKRLVGSAHAAGKPNGGD